MGMNLNQLKKTIAIFCTVWVSYSAVQLPTEMVNLRETLKKIRARDNVQGLTYAKGLFPKTPPPRVATPEECNRQCYIRAPPKTCYYRFVVEHYATVGGACDLCVRNETNNCQCILADGIERTVIVVNRQFPGPSIQVCTDDHVIVDVVNAADGSELTIHWHGILQYKSHHYDGVPFVTQCPIHKGNSMRYKFHASNPGSHFYHSHTGFQKMDGLFGTIIVREASDVHQHLYDDDNSILVISDWFHTLSTERFPGLINTPGQDPDNVLINGKGQYFDPVKKIATNTPLEIFNVERGKRYRFRVINACASTCPVHLFIEKHRMKIIATDGESVEPVIVDSLISMSAERYDFVLYANQPVGTYWIHVKAKGLCELHEVQQLAILRYKDGPDTPTSKPPSFSNSFPEGIVMNPIDSECSEEREDRICIEQLESAYPVQPEILKEVPDVKLYLPFKFLPLTKEQLFKPNVYYKYIRIFTGDYLIGVIDDISYVSASSPPASQYNDIDPKQFCDDDNRPEGCGSHCVCTHRIKIPLNAVVEVVLVDEVQIENMQHPFHIHGYTIYVMGMGRLPNVNESITLEKAITLDMERGLRTKFRRPPGKDTLPVPNNGYAVFRFVADNPGFWFFHCHFLFHLTIGMSLVVQVGELEDMPPVPKGFPKCGNFLPPFN